MPAVRLVNVRWDHEAIMDFMIANPQCTQNQIAQEFGFTASRLSIIINSKAFKDRFAERKVVLSDPLIRASIEDKLQALASQSLNKLLERVDNNVPISNGDLIRMAQLGVGDRNQTKNHQTVNQSLYVVNLPPQAPSAKTWKEQAQGIPVPLTLENEAG